MNLINECGQLYTSSVVPLFEIVDEDKLVWLDDVRGNYSVKSGYNMLLNSTISAAPEEENNGWKWIWKVHALPKIKHLLWRICKQCLPMITEY
jgi:hypothetical protein